MKNFAGVAVLFLFVTLSSCRKDPSVHANHLRIEAANIQNSTLQAILKNDLKFEIDLDEQDRLFASLRADLQRCRDIEAELRKISAGTDVSKLEEGTSGLLLAISNREKYHRSYRDETIQEHESDDPSKEIEALKRTIEIFEESGHDTEEMEQLLDQLHKKQAEAGSGQPDTRSGLDSEGSDKPQSE
jgi:hypothetical protein